MREIAVLGGTAHPALAAEICADLGRLVRGKPGQQRRCLTVLPGCGAGQREPFTMSLRMTWARAAKT